jgi:hypothetical protein
MTRTALLGSLLVVCSAASFTAGRASQAPTVGATFVSGGGLAITVLLDESTLGTKDLDIGEITFPDTKALVIWTPGGEAQRIVRSWQRR